MSDRKLVNLREAYDAAVRAAGEKEKPQLVEAARRAGALSAFQTRYDMWREQEFVPADTAWNDVLAAFQQVGVKVEAHLTGFGKRALEAATRGTRAETWSDGEVSGTVELGINASVRANLVGVRGLKAWAEMSPEERKALLESARSFSYDAKFGDGERVTGRLDRPEDFTRTLDPGSVAADATGETLATMYLEQGLAARTEADAGNVLWLLGIMDPAVQSIGELSPAS